MNTVQSYCLLEIHKKSFSLHYSHHQSGEKKKQHHMTCSIFHCQTSSCCFHISQNSIRFALLSSLRLLLHFQPTNFALFLQNRSFGSFLELKKPIWIRNEASRQEFSHSKQFQRLFTTKFAEILTATPKILLKRDTFSMSKSCFALQSGKRNQF